MSADLGIRAAVRAAIDMDLGDVWRDWLAGREAWATDWSGRTPYSACLYTRALPNVHDAILMTALARAPDLSRARA
jgi:glutamyl/glutaminyl-tRNA synthetase